MRTPSRYKSNGETGYLHNYTIGNEYTEFLHDLGVASNCPRYYLVPKSRALTRTEVQYAGERCCTLAEAAEQQDLPC
jgi:hypothetical protein